MNERLKSIINTINAIQYENDYYKHRIVGNMLYLKDSRFLKEIQEWFPNNLYLYVDVLGGCILTKDFEYRVRIDI